MVTKKSTKKVTKKSKTNVKTKKIVKKQIKQVELDFEMAFKYPFKRAKGMLNIFWILLPIFGWFALGGYTIRIIKEFMEGKFEQLPEMSFSKDMKFGFMMFLKSIPFTLAYLVIIIIFSAINENLAGVANALLGLLIIPILSLNFLKKETVESYFEFKIIKAVFNNFGDYLIAILKSIALVVVFLVMWIILVGIPAGAFTKNIFLADFYRKNVK